jgi:hypothetical protein
MVATEILQRLYASEINATISWMYDAGFEWKLGDDANGWKARGTAKTIDDAAVGVGRDDRVSNERVRGMVGGGVTFGR